MEEKQIPQKYYWNGQPCWKAIDLERCANLRSGIISTILRRKSKLTRGTDYEVLSGENVKKFYIENNLQALSFANTTHFTIITISALKFLISYFDFKSPEGTSTSKENGEKQKCNSVGSKLILKTKQVKQDKKAFNIYMEENLIKQIDKIGKQTKYSRNELINLMVEYSLKNLQVENNDLDQ